MLDEHGKSKKKEYYAKILLISIFLGGFALFIGWMTIYGPGWQAFQLSWLDLTLLGLATYRLGRLIAYDRVMEPFRQFFTVTGPDSTGAGDSVEPKGTGFQQSLGQLISCPICAGTWVAALLVYLLYLFPGPMHVFLTMTAAIGLAELFNAVTEAWCWTGQNNRVMAGAQIRAQQQAKQMQEQSNVPLDSSLRIENPNANTLVDMNANSQVYSELHRLPA